MLVRVLLAVALLAALLVVVGVGALGSALEREHSAMIVPAQQPERSSARVRQPRLVEALRAGLPRGEIARKSSIAVRPYVRGYIVCDYPTDWVAMVEKDERVRVDRQYIPGVAVVLQDPVTRKIIARTRTDLSGRFNFPEVPPGTYQLCWRHDGFLSGCMPELVTVGALPVYLAEVSMSLASRDGHRVLYGEVRAADGDPHRYLDPLSGVNSFAVVRALNTRGDVVGETLVNNAGWYLIPQVPESEFLTIEAVTDSGTEQRSIHPEKMKIGATHRVDVRLSNHRPAIGPVIVTKGGALAATIEFGDVVDLAAAPSDPEGGPLTLEWTVSGGQILSGDTGSTMRWRAPTKPGRYTATLLAADQEGGFSQVQVALPVGQKGVAFSGLVEASDAGPLAKATVEVNGVSTVTDASGRFRMEISPARRYVVNIRAEGYSLLSQIRARPVQAGLWTLRPLSVFVADPTRDIIVEDHRREGCSGLESARVNWRIFAESAKPRFQDGRGNTIEIGSRPYRYPLLEKVATERQEKCGPGVRVKIPANSLVDANGKPPTGLVNVGLRTIDPLARDEMPGDYSAVTENGRPGYMETWGAAVVEVYSGTTKYNLKAGAEATVEIPVTDLQLAYPGAEPATIPLLVYDETEGVWRQEGEATLVGDRYVATVKHFSAFNSDLVKTDQACVQIYSATLPATYNLEVTIPQGGGAAPRVLTLTVNNSTPYHVIYNLPTDTDIILVAFSDVGVPYGTFVVNTGGTQDNPSQNLPDYPYDACKATVELYEVELPNPPTDAFLHGLYSFAATNLDELTSSDPALKAELELATVNYYNQADPRHLRRNLDDFKAINGFTGSGIAAARFANTVDLGFGREMYGVKQLADDGQEDIAFYVTNHVAGGVADLGDALGDNSDDAADFEAAVLADPSTAFATVAMEWSRIEDGPADPNNPTDPADPVAYSDPERAIKFYVYGADGSIVGQANLDGYGNRPIPQLCVVCHGGVPPYPDPFVPDVPAFGSRDSVKMGSLFLPFDLAGFTIVDGVDPSYNKAAQQPEFKALNDLVRQSIVDAGAPAHPIVELIDAWYAASGSVQDEDAVVSGWTGDAAEQAVYQNVVARSCRTCHVARPAETGRDIRFHTAPSFVGGGLDFAVPYRVCSELEMPHAVATFNRFWGSYDPLLPALYPFQPAQLIAYGSTNIPTNPDYCFDCAELGAPPDETGFVAYSEIQGIWNSNCVGCHNSSTALGGLDLSSATSYANIVNRSSDDVPSLDRIEPGSPDSSYLWHKLQGTQLTVGGDGDLMPQDPSDDTPLPSDTLDRIRQWILEGAAGP